VNKVACDSLVASSYIRLFGDEVELVEILTTHARDDDENVRCDERDSFGNTAVSTAARQRCR